jgi:hypothetical protein
VTPTLLISPSVTPSKTPSVTPSKTIPLSPSHTPSHTPSRTPAPSQISNTSFANYPIYDLNEMLFISDSGGNVPPYNKQGNEYVSNTILNKAIMKVIANNQTLASYLNYRFSGTLTPQTNDITSGDIIPMTETEKQSINIGYDNNYYVNVNEKTAPQVLTRIFEKLYNVGNTIANLAEIKITNFNQLIETLDIAIPLITPTPSPSHTPSHSPTPSITPSKSITPTPTTTPSVSITVTPSHSPSYTPSSTPPASVNDCDTWVFIATNAGGTGVVTAQLCGLATNTNYVFTDGQTFCIVHGTTPTATGGTVSLLNLGC